MSRQGTFWARIHIYEPFRFGPPWNWYRYQVQAEKIKVAKYDAFVFFDTHRQQWSVHEASTGGWLASHEDKDRAVWRAEYDIKRTPDFAKQVAALSPLMRLPVIDADEALRRLAKSKDQEKSADEEDIDAMRDTRTLEL